MDAFNHSISHGKKRICSSEQNDNNTNFAKSPNKNYYERQPETKRKKPNCTNDFKSDYSKFPSKAESSKSPCKAESSMPPNPTKYSASARLKKLRETLEESKKEGSKHFSQSSSSITNHMTTSQKQDTCHKSTELMQSRLKQYKTSLSTTPHSNAAIVTTFRFNNENEPKETNSYNPQMSFSNISYTASSSNSSLICNVNSFTDLSDEDMDWSPIDQEGLLSDIRLARQILSEQPTSMQISNNVNYAQSGNNIERSNNIYIVVDTNVFIDKLQTIVNVLHINYKDSSRPVIYVPWMVIQELDYFKDGYSVNDKHPISIKIQTMCRKAVKFINECLLSKKSNFKGQSIRDAVENKLNLSSPDDSILSCCFQVASTGNEVILLSSDTNLRNKALINNITAHPPNEIIKILLNKRITKREINITHEISEKLSLLCSFIIHSEIKYFYGDNLYAKKKFKELPWDLIQCIKYMKDSYNEVFRSVLQKQCLKVINDFYEVLKDGINNENSFVELSLSLLMYLRTGLPKYNINIQRLINEIKELERKYLV